VCHLCLCPRTLAAVSPHRHHLCIFLKSQHAGRLREGVRLEFVHEKFKSNLQSSRFERSSWLRASSAFWKMLKDKSKRRESR
jgi:hypothetical protein